MKPSDYEHQWWDIGRAIKPLPIKNKSFAMDIERQRKTYEAAAAMMRMNPVVYVDDPYTYSSAASKPEGKKEVNEATAQPQDYFAVQCSDYHGVPSIQNGEEAANSSAEDYARRYPKSTVKVFKLVEVSEISVDYKRTVKRAAKKGRKARKVKRAAKKAH